MLSVKCIYHLLHILMIQSANIETIQKRNKKSRDRRTTNRMKFYLRSETLNSLYRILVSMINGHVHIS